MSRQKRPRSCLTSETAETDAAGRAKSEKAATPSLSDRKTSFPKLSFADRTADSAEEKAKSCTRTEAVASPADVVD